MTVPPMTNKMTVQFCLDTCASSGYPLAGLEYGRDCWCGNQMPSDIPISANCNMGCSGDGSQYVPLLSLSRFYIVIYLVW